jgi:dipeptidyl aminopeptidase/acylaminoacyl peptidase
MISKLLKRNDVVSATKIELPTKRDVVCYRIIYKVKNIQLVGFLLHQKTRKRSIPVTIILRGRSGEFGALNPAKLAKKYAAIANAGYIVLTTQYPGVDGGEGTDDFGGPVSMAAMLKLREFIKAIPQADEKRIGLVGHSRGGMMVYMLLRQTRWAKAAVIGGAPVDEIAAAKERKGWREHQIKMFGKSKQAQIDRSAIYWVDELSSKTPLLLVHGAADWRVKPTHSLRMSEALIQQQVPHRLIIFEGADHHLSEHTAAYLNETITWLNRYVMNKEALPDTKPHGR